MIPVIPLWFPRADLNRIVPWARRRELPFALAFDRERVPADYFRQALTLADRLFLFSPEEVEAARAAKFSGELFLFSGGTMLSWPQWYRDHAVRPVVSALPNWEASAGLDPLYLATTKRCVAEFGACRSRGGSLQQFTYCDHRCRDKVHDRQSVGAPFSLRPEYVHPPDAVACVAYDETALNPALPRSAKPVVPILNEAWNHPWPIGRRILTEAHKTSDTRFYFNLSADEKRLFEEGLFGYWGYRESIYDGGWVTPVKATPFKGRLLLTLAAPVRKLLLVQTHDAASRELFKRARHQLYTMPEQALFAPVITEEEPPALRIASRKQVRLTLILDDPERKTFFRIRDIDRVALLYDGTPVGKFFNNYLYIPFPLTDEEARKIASHTRLRGVIVQDRLMRRMFQILFAGSKREVLLHPAVLMTDEESPSYLAGNEQVFRSCYTSERRKDYQWKGTGMRLVNYRSHSFFFKEARLLREGDLPELWIDVLGCDDDTVRALKVRAERFLKEKRSSAG